MLDRLPGLQLEDSASRLAQSEAAREIEQRQHALRLEQERLQLNGEMAHYKDVANFETIRRKEVQSESRRRPIAVLRCCDAAMP